MFDTMCEGTFIDATSFDSVQSDGRFGACQFETIAAAQGDGRSAKGLRAAASAFILRRPDARVQYGARLISIAELTEQLAGLSSRDYALKLSKCGVWGDGASFAVACQIDGLRGHVLLPCGRDKLFVALVCGPRDGRPLFARLFRGVKPRPVLADARGPADGPGKQPPRGLRAFAVVGLICW